MMFNPGCRCCATANSPNTCCGCGPDRPAKYTFPALALTGTYNDGAGPNICQCTAFNILTEIMETLPCLWTAAAPYSCSIPGHPTPDSIRATLYCTVGAFLLEFTAVNNLPFDNLTMAQYVLAAADWDCTGANTLDLAELPPPICSGWPATITLTPG